MLVGGFWNAYKNGRDRANNQISKLQSVNFDQDEIDAFRDMAGKMGVPKATEALIGFSDAQKDVLKYLAENPSANLQEAIAKLGESARESGNLFQVFKSKGLDALKGLGMAIGNFAAAAFLSAAISVAIKLTDEWINHTKHLNDSARDFGSQMKSTEKDLDSYAEKIAAQRAIINDNKSSIEDVTNARSTLHELQKQMIETYGTEKDAIRDIINAIDGESDAIDRNIKKLKERQYQNSVEDFEKKNGGLMQRLTASMKQQQILDDGTTVLVPMTAFEEFMDNMEHSKVNMTELLNLSTPELRKVYDKYAQERGWGNDPSQITDHVDVLMDFFDEYTSTLETLHNSVDGGMAESQYNAIKKQTSQLRAPVRETSEQNRDLYDQTMLHELRTGMYSETYDLLNDLYTQYTKAETDQTKEQVIKAYSAAVEQIKADNSIEYGLKEALLNQYPDLKAQVDKWSFDVKFEADEEHLKTSVAKAIGDLSRSNNGERFTSDELLNWDESAHTTEQNVYRENLVQLADQYGISFEHIIQKALDSGLLFTREFAELVKVMGADTAGSLSASTQKILSEYKGAAKTFQSWYSRGLKKYRDEAKATAYAIAHTIQDATKEATKGVSAETRTVRYANATSGLSDISKVYSDVADGKGFDWSQIGEGFKEKYKDLDKYSNAYSEFIETISKSPGDINACQKSFDKLASAWVASTGALDDLKLEDRSAAISTLAENGFTLESATKLVDAAIEQTNQKLQDAAAATEYLEQQAYDLSGATLQEANDFITEANATDAVRQELARLYLQKIATNGVSINTTGDIENLKALAQAAHLTREELAKLKISALKGAAAMEKAQTAKVAAEQAGVVAAGGVGALRQMEAPTRNIIAAFGDLEEETVEPFNWGDFSGGASNSSGGGGGSGGGSDRAKERQEAEEEWAWEERAIQLKKERLAEIDKLINSQYTINEDAKQSSVDSAEAFANLADIKQQLEDRGIDVDSDEFQTYIQTVDLSGTVDGVDKVVDEVFTLEDALADGALSVEEFDEVVQGGVGDAISESNTPIDENNALIAEYVKTLEALEDVDTQTSKTLHENGKGKLSYLEEAIELQKDIIEDQKTRLSGIGTDLEKQFDKIREMAGESADEWIEKIKSGDLNPEEEFKITKYDQNNKEEKELVEAIKKAVSLQDDYNSKTKELGDEEEDLLEKEQKRYELQLNMLKARQAEIQSLVDEAQFDLDMKEVLGEVVQEADYQRLIDLNDDLIANYREQLSVLREQKDSLDEDEDAYYDVSSQIRDVESAIRDCVKQQAEWNDTILRMPVENISRFLGLVTNLGKILTNWLSVNDAKGIAKSAEQIQTSWDTAFDQIADDELGIVKQLSDYQTLIENYDLGSTKFSEVDDEITNACDSMESLVSEMIELNRQLLMLPVDKISEMTTYLDGTLSDLQSIQSDYETTIQTVIDLITENQEQLEDEYSKLEKSIESEIKPLQEQLDLLEKQNTKKDRELAIENALFELEKAREQKTVQVKQVA